MADENKTILWWRLLSAVAALNILLWLWTWATVDAVTSYQRWQLALSGIYVAVCAFRSFLPRIDLERYCIVDSPLSSVFLGRTGATFAEVSFAAQIALWLYALASLADLPVVMAWCYAIVPLLATAQVFCWYGILTKNHLAHAIEESLWAGTMAVVGLCLVAMAFTLPGGMRTVAILGVLGSIGYVAFMVTVDVPMYVRRWRERRAAGVAYLSLGEGFAEVVGRRRPTRSWEVWQPEVAWLSGYFSFAVWLSIALVHFPF